VAGWNIPAMSDVWTGMETCFLGGTLEMGLSYGGINNSSNESRIDTFRNRYTGKQAVASDNPLAELSSVVSSPAVNVVLGSDTSSVNVPEIVFERTFDRILSGVGMQEHSSATAGRAGFQSRATEATDTSTEGTAQRIYEGITGRIYENFLNANPDASTDDIQTLHESILEGMQLGIQDARDILSGLGVMTSSVSDSITETENLVRGQLDTFFANQLQTA
jgi:hypothetical protein